MTWRLIDQEREHHAVSRLCQVLGVTPQGYYASKTRGPSARSREDATLKSKIRAVWDGSRETYGAPRIHAELRIAHHIRLGRKRVARLMGELAIEGVSRRRGRTRTTTSDPRTPPAPDRLNRCFAAARPDAVWVADITYIPTYESWLFLACVMDLYSRKIVGWSMRDDLSASLVIDAVSMAISRRAPEAGLIHHTDRGSQYTSIAMGKTLRDAQILPSMGSVGDPWDNAAAESCISTIKNELVRGRSYTTKDQARLAVFEYIECFYNPLRRHSACNQHSPDHYERIYHQTTNRDLVATT
jgi:putative transposase